MPKAIGSGKPISSWLPGWRRTTRAPSDPRARAGRGQSFGGVDVEGNTREELYERARAPAVPGRSRMNRRELAAAIGRRQ